MSEKLKLPVRPRNYRFALTPLADAMFQLLIFFMLTSSLTPYSLLTVQDAPAPETEDSAGTNPGAATPAGPAPDVAIWTLERETVTVGGQSFGLDQLDTLADALGSEAVPADVVILVRDSARVQDVASVLARLSTAHVRSVRIAEGSV